MSNLIPQPPTTEPTKNNKTVKMGLASVVRRTVQEQEARGGKEAVAALLGRRGALVLRVVGLSVGAGLRI